MSRVKKQHGGGYEIWTPAGRKLEPTSDRPTDVLLMGRQVEGSSIADLNNSTQGLGKKVPRILDTFWMGMVHARKLKEALTKSPLEEPPSIEDMVERFARLPRRVQSLGEPLVADVTGVRPYQGEVAVYLDYELLHEESMVMANALARYLDLPHPHDVVPSEPHIVIVEGQLSRVAQLADIEAAVPDQIKLSAMKPVPQS